jgi:hypothetical protein
VSRGRRHVFSGALGQEELEGGTNGGQPIQLQNLGLPDLSGLERSTDGATLDGLGTRTLPSSSPERLSLGCSTTRSPFHERVMSVNPRYKVAPISGLTRCKGHPTEHHVAAETAEVTQFAQPLLPSVSPPNIG